MHDQSNKWLMMRFTVIRRTVHLSGTRPGQTGVDKLSSLAQTRDGDMW